VALTITLAWVRGSAETSVGLALDVMEEMVGQTMEQAVVVMTVLTLMATEIMTVSETDVRNVAFAEEVRG